MPSQDFPGIGIAMAAATISADFIKSLRKSNLLSADDVRKHVEQHGSGYELAQALVAEGILTQYQCDRLLAGKWRGLVRGKFKVLGKLGSGGLSTVYLAEHRFIRKQVALKVIRPDEATDEACLARLYREARLLARLDHPNLIRIFDIEHVGDEHFLVMEHFAGENLRDLVKEQGSMSISEAVRCMYQAALGLHHVHERGLLHRDVKPGNILLNEDGRVKLIDFSLSRLPSDRSDLITVHYCKDAFLGSADYAAPEQFRDSQTIDLRADLYGLGATFYYLLAGRPPFPAEQFSDKRQAHETKPLTSIRVLRPEVPEALANILNKMLAKKAADRYQSAQEIAEALAPWVRSGSREFVLPAAAQMPVCTPCGDGITTPAWEIGLNEDKALPVIWTPPPVANLFPECSPESNAVACPSPTSPECSDSVSAAKGFAADDLPSQVSRWRRWGGVTLSTLIGAAIVASIWYMFIAK
jgi:serine/threonine protein kinase